MQSALEGTRILELANFQMGPAATVMLADLGADVIKIEDPAGGDLARGMVKLLSQTTGLTWDRNFYFETINRNKRSITIDLKKERGREILHRLVPKADAVVTNTRLGVAARLGADYATLARHNPRLVYAHASGYGPEGRDATKPAFDPLGLARSGMMEVLTPANSPPQWPTGALADQAGATILSYAVLAGLICASLTGRGQMVSTSLFGSTIWLEQLNANAMLMLGQKPEFERRQAGNPIYNYYRCADGKWLFLALFEADRLWPVFCVAAGLEHLRHDPRFATTAQREANCAALIDMLDAVFASKTAAEWAAQLGQYRELVFDIVSTISGLAADAQVLANRYIVDFDHPELGPIKMMGFPITFNEVPATVRLPAPALGQHTEEILLEIGGYSWDEIVQLREEAVI